MVQCMTYYQASIAVGIASLPSCGMASLEGCEVEALFSCTPSACGAGVTASKSTGNLVTLGLSASILRHSLHSIHQLSVGLYCNGGGEALQNDKADWRLHPPINEWRVWWCLKFSELLLPVFSADIVPYPDKFLHCHPQVSSRCIRHAAQQSQLYYSRSGSVGGTIQSHKLQPTFWR